MLALIKTLVATHSVETCEQALVREHLAQTGLRVQRNQALLDALAQEASDVPAARAAIVAAGIPITLENLVQGFELLIPGGDRKLNGAFFTPQPIAAYLAAQVIGPDTRTILDPACGCGALLIEAARRQAHLTGDTLRTVIERDIYGVDICDYNARRAAILLGLLALNDGEDAPMTDLHLRVANSLDTDWNELFPDVATAGGFDAITGNPPYVRFQHLPDDVRVDLQRWETVGEGNFNLYFAFFELGRQLLAPAGRLAYITPNSFFHLRAAAPLREWLTHTGFLDEIVDFGEHMVFEAMTYTCITTATPAPTQAPRYTRLAGTEALATPAAFDWTPAPLADLVPARWTFVAGRRGRAIDAMRRQPDLVPLGHLVSMKGGIATLRDKLFFVDGATAGRDGRLVRVVDGVEYPIEVDITRPCLRVSDFATQEALAANTRRIIYPYTLTDAGPVIVADDQLRDTYPGAYAYLEAVRSELAARDKGKKEYPAWYAYGRTQGLTPIGAALFTPLYAAEPRFLSDATAGRLFCNGTALILRPEAAEAYGGDWVSVDLVQALLHQSPVLAAFMAELSNKIAGGYSQYGSALLAEFPVPRLTRAAARELIGADPATRTQALLDAYAIRAAQLTA